MHSREIKITSYSGYKDEESPLSFLMDDEKIGVVEVLKKWIEEEQGSRKIKRFFKVQGSDGYIHTLFYDEQLKAWFLITGGTY